MEGRGGGTWWRDVVGCVGGMHVVEKPGEGTWCGTSRRDVVVTWWFWGRRDEGMW